MQAKYDLLHPQEIYYNTNDPAENVVAVPVLQFLNFFISWMSCFQSQ